MLEQIAVLEAVAAMNRVGRDASRHSIRKLCGGTPSRATKVLAQLKEYGLVHSHPFRHRSNCVAVAYSTTPRGRILLKVLAGEPLTPLQHRLL